jgi:hypothetical protein
MGAIINFLRLLQLLSRAWRLFIPWIQRQVMGFFVFLSLITFGVFGNIPPTLNRLATIYRDRAQERLGITEFDQTLYWLFYFLAIGMIVIGWIFLSWLTMFLVHLIF